MSVCLSSIRTDGLTEEQFHVGSCEWDVFSLCSVGDVSLFAAALLNLYWYSVGYHGNRCGNNWAACGEHYVNVQSLSCRGFIIVSGWKPCWRVPAAGPALSWPSMTHLVLAHICWTGRWISALSYFLKDFLTKLHEQMFQFQSCEDRSDWWWHHLCDTVIFSETLPYHETLALLQRSTLTVGQCIIQPRFQNSELFL